MKSEFGQSFILPPSQYIKRGGGFRWDWLDGSTPELELGNLIRKKKEQARGGGSATAASHTVL